VNRRRLKLLANVKASPFCENMIPCSRRNLLRSAALIGVASLWPRSLFSATARRDGVLRLGVVLDAASPETAAGITLGGEEGIRSSALFRRRVDVLTEDIGRSALDAAARRLVEHDVSVLVSALAGLDDCAKLGELAGRQGLGLINAASAADELRGERCARHVFHVAASRAMYDSALALAAMGGFERGGDARGAAKTPDAGTASALMWHPALERFGAGQLNTRFRARFGRDMTGEAWAGWMSVKVAVEAFLRAASPEPRALRGYLERSDTQFDGHKGVPLSFRSWDHQLRQPLYVTGNGGEVAEVPPAGGASTLNDRDLLDSLGGTTRGSCRWT
jgi:hypothetical protein